ncbi:universal stress protein [Bradyrhizobium sp. 27S5]|uniref:universal stress protein n=1 Tax=Bradyrhizobium sp. 27S5 TaxID=3139728 RepID=UPI0030D2BEEF
MNIQDVLLVLTTYPNASDIDAVKWATSFSELVNCRIAAFVADVKIEIPGNLLGNSLMNVSALVGAEMNKSKENARSMLATFGEEADKRGVVHELIHERCLVGAVPDLMADYARLRDLTIIPMPADDRANPAYAETVVFQSGRPVLIVPKELPRTEAKLDAIAVAWDFSRTAVRAVADAIPLLERAKTVRIICVVNEKSFNSSRASFELATHLARHGINVIVDEVDSEGRAIGDVLTQFVSANKVDLLVMGAYGHSRFREFILGGATRSIMSRPPVPTLLSH